MSYSTQPSLKLNIVANFLGNIWPSVIGLVAVPFYLKLLGAEAYGLIGVFATLQAILSILDGGLSTTLNRELARSTTDDQGDNTVKVRNTVKTLEIVYWFLAAVVSIIAIILTPFIAKSWVTAHNLTVSEIQISFTLLSISLLFQLPNGFYTGGLLGLQKQVSLNVLRVIFSTLKSVGAVMILYFYSATVISFFSWILFVAICQSMTFKKTLWRYLPLSDVKAEFDKVQLKRIWRFAAGITGISITALIISQIDKVILSKILPLDQFGYYSLATTLGFLVFQIISPLTDSFFPKFASYVAKPDLEQSLIKTYHDGCQLISILTLPITFVIVFFSRELLFIWTHNMQTAEYSWKIVSIFAIGAGLNGIMHMPYQLTLAYGWTKFAFYTNIALTVLLIPFTVFFTFKLGGIGGALSWLSINFLYFTVTPHILHKKILIGQKLKWYLNDSLKPLCISFIFIGFIRFLDFKWPFENKIIALFYLGTICLATVVINIVFMKSIYKALVGALSVKFKKNIL